MSWSPLIVPCSAEQAIMAEKEVEESFHDAIRTMADQMQEFIHQLMIHGKASSPNGDVTTSMADILADGTWLQKGITQNNDKAFEDYFAKVINGALLRKTWELDSEYGPAVV
jgi:hypothetical protein